MFSFENTLREQKFRYLKMTFHYTKLIFLTEPYTPKSKMGKHDQNFWRKKLISMRCPSHRGRSRHGREICAPPGELRSPTALDVRGRVNSWFLNYNCNNWDDPAAKNFFKLNYKTYMNAKKSIVQEQSWKMPPQTSHQLRLHRMRYGERCMKTLKRTCTICMLPGCLGTTQGEGCQSASDPPSVRSGLCTN